MKFICVISSYSFCIITHILTKIKYDNKLTDLKNQLTNAQQQLVNYRESGAIQKVKIYVKTYPNETRGLLSLVYHSEWVTLEEAKKRKDILY